MAGKKGRSGRPKKRTIAKVEEKTVTISPNLVDQMFPQLPPSPNPEGSSTPSQTSSPASGSFDATAAQLEDKYGPAADAPGGDTAAATPGTDSSAAAVVIEVLPPETVKKYIAIIFDGASRSHGDHWRLSAGESEIVAQSTTDMLNEQAPKWLAESTNKFLIIWCVLMLGIVATRSQTLSAKLEALIERVMSMGKPPQPKETPQ